MTNNEIIQAIKAEIERLKLEAQENCPEQTINRNYTPTQWQAIGEYNAYEIVGLFLSTLESEKPMQDGLEDEIERYIPTSLAVKFPTTDIETIKSDIRYIAHHFAQWGAEHTKE